MRWPNCDEDDRRALGGLTAREERELRGDVIERDLAGGLDQRLQLGAAECDWTVSFERPVE